MPIKINGATSGSTTITAPATGSDESIELSTALASKLDLAGGKILQTVSATNSTQTNTTSATYVTTNLNASITPSSASNKVFAMAITNGYNNTANQYTTFRLFRGTAAGTGVGSEVQAGSGSAATTGSGSCIALDSPSTTSAQTYTLCMKVSGGTGAAQYGNIEANIILMEVSA